MVCENSSNLTELVEGYSVELRRDVSTAKRVFLCPWSTRNTHTYSFLGGWRHPDKNFEYPQRHPVYVGLVVVGVDVVPHGIDTVSTDDGYHQGSDLNVDQAKLTVHYESVKLADVEESSSSESSMGEYDIARIDIEYSAEMLTLKGFKWVWAEGPNRGKALDDHHIQPYKIIPLKQIVVTLSERWQIKESSFNESVGKINKTVFAGHGAQTLLFLGGRTVKKLTSEGVEFQQAEIRLAFKRTGWNNFWDDTNFQPIWNTGVKPLTQNTVDETLCDSALVYECFEVRDIIKQDISEDLTP